MIAVAGHLCLDVIPQLDRDVAAEPGSLHEVGPATFAVGGAVGNVGQALARLGVPARLLGRVGADPFGAIVRDLLGSAGGDLTPVSDAATSYSLVLSPPGGDRTFLHHPGCNDGFGGPELRAAWNHHGGDDVDVLHFGYPPIMQSTFEDGGAALADAFSQVRESNTWVSLDMATPDPSGVSGTVDWQAFLQRVLPQVDVFAPSWDDLAGMLDDVPRTPTAADVRALADRCIEWGARAVLLKLGDAGLYLRTSAGAGSPDHAGPDADEAGVWSDRELWSENFQVEARGTTGAGDATIAGFLAGVARGQPPEKALLWASAVGACSVEGLDATSRIPTLKELEERIERGWERASSSLTPRAGADRSFG